MSFPKAKIQRFNDVKDCTPSPANYNVETKEKIKLGIISKSGRYLKKTGSPPSSEGGSVHSTPCFQTPTVPSKRKKILGMTFKSIKECKLPDQEELREKIVECKNKDLYIKDLNEQIEEMAEKLNNVNVELLRLQDEKNECVETIDALKKRKKEDCLQKTKEYALIDSKIKEFNLELKQIRKSYQKLHSENLADLRKISASINDLQILYNKTVEASREELEAATLELQKKDAQNKETIELLNTKHQEEICQLRNEETKLQQALQKLALEKEEILKKLEEREAKIDLLEENFKDVKLLAELHTREKIEEVEAVWEQKLQDQAKEHEAILKECQEISEYNIIQSEIEKNQVRKTLEDKEKESGELSLKNHQLEDEVENLKIEKHAYELSVTTFRDTIDVLTKRLFNSDRDVEQLKEELEKSEEKILSLEKKSLELTEQLRETQQSNDELEMQYESTSKLLQDQVESTQKQLLEKVEKLEEGSIANKLLLKDALEHNHQQQLLLNEAQETITRFNSIIESQEKKETELETQLNSYKLKLSEEIEEASEIRKKYIEKSGKYDELAQQFEQILQEYDQSKSKIEELQQLIEPYQEQLEAYQNDLKLLNVEKSSMENEVKELGLKYAQVLGHQNHLQKIKYVKDLRMKQSELFQKNLDLESRNYVLTKQVEKLKKENEDLRKPGRKVKAVDDKENLASPKCLKDTHSPGPLKNKN